MNISMTGKWNMIRFTDSDCSRDQEDEVVTEMPLTVKLEGEEIATIVCSPSNLEDMVIGFLAAEGLIRLMDDIVSMQLDEDRGFAYVELQQKKLMAQAMPTKRYIGSCCGKSREFYFYSDMKTAKTAIGRKQISVLQCFELMRTLQHQSEDFHRTGGVHNAALCDPNQLITLRSDIGRHNALDKIYGYCIQHRVKMKDKVIAFSGRISSEVILKVAKMGVGILLSKSAPSDLALRLANDLNITVVGFIRGNSLNVYTHPERIQECST